MKAKRHMTMDSILGYRRRPYCAWRTRMMLLDIAKTDGRIDGEELCRRMHLSKMETYEFRHRPFCRRDPQLFKDRFYERFFE